MISKKLSLRFVVAGSVATSLLAVPVGVLAFAPESWHELYGAIGKSHESQTLDALRQVIAQVYKTSAPSRSSLRALDVIAAADAKIDTGETKDLGRYHFDGERFVEAQKVIADSVKDVVWGLKNDRLEGARFKLGSSLHTLQDFYSHSNWIEKMNTTPHPEAGRDLTIQNTALTADKTCVECLIINVGCTDCSANLNTTKSI
jgi:hypothetical protein